MSNGAVGRCGSLLYVACCVCYVWFVVVRCAVLFAIVYRRVSRVVCFVTLALCVDCSVLFVLCCLLCVVCSVLFVPFFHPPVRFVMCC